MWVDWRIKETKSSLADERQTENMSRKGNNMSGGITEKKINDQYIIRQHKEHNEITKCSNGNPYVQETTPMTFQL